MRDGRTGCSVSTKRHVFGRPSTRSVRGSRVSAVTSALIYWDIHGDISWHTFTYQLIMKVLMRPDEETPERAYRRG